MVESGVAAEACCTSARGCRAPGRDDGAFLRSFCRVWSHQRGQESDKEFDWALEHLKLVHRRSQMSERWIKN